LEIGAVAEGARAAGRHFGADVGVEFTDAPATPLRVEGRAFDGWCEFAVIEIAAVATGTVLRVGGFAVACLRRGERGSGLSERGERDRGKRRGEREVLHRRTCLVYNRRSAIVCKSQPQVLWLPASPAGRWQISRFTVQNHFVSRRGRQPKLSTSYITATHVLRGRGGEAVQPGFTLILLGLSA
jgi:hypothetical protein